MTRNHHPHDYAKSLNENSFAASGDPAMLLSGHRLPVRCPPAGQQARARDGGRGEPVSPAQSFLLSIFQRLEREELLQRETGLMHHDFVEKRRRNVLVAVKMHGCEPPGCRVAKIMGTTLDPHDLEARSLELSEHLPAFHRPEFDHCSSSSRGCL